MIRIGSGAAIDGVARDLDVARKAPVDRIEPQQMGIGFGRREIVDRDDFDVLAPGFDDGAQHIAADAAEAVNGNPDCHFRLLNISASAAAGAGLTECIWWRRRRVAQ